ncbi:MAG: hypothetical protein L3J15_07700 [Devosiaceae bacterium]|nr:hypothetical protein [Devosiaceae bacterium]
MFRIHKIYHDEEKEILVLKAVMDSIKSMVNHELFTLYHNDPNSQIMFETSIHQKYFNIILVDFLSARILDENKCLEALQVIIKNPKFNPNVQSLKQAVESFQQWLGQEVNWELFNETRKLWFPSINQEVELKITRNEYICICGNIAKHNPQALTRQAKTIKKIFKNSGVEIQKNQGLLAMEEFYEQFHDDIFLYHSSMIAEFLNNVLWAIHEYLQPLYTKSKKPFFKNGEFFCHYEYPSEIKDDYVKTIFYNLMNDVSSKPCMVRFKVNEYLKTRY